MPYGGPGPPMLELYIKLPISFTSTFPNFSTHRPVLLQTNEIRFVSSRIRKKKKKKEEAMRGGVLVEDGFLFQEETHLTVCKTSVFFADDGFNVYDGSGDLIFRVDSYGPDSRGKGEVVLMDAHGRCLLTVRRKWPSLHQRWEGFRGERLGQKPIFSVRRSSIIGRSGLTAEVFGDPNESEEEKEGCLYIEGSFAQRCCTVLDSGREVVAEIKRKVDPTTNVILGKDVFSLSLMPGFDGAFAMGLILVLDHINGDDDDDADDQGGNDGAEVGLAP